MYVYIYTLRPLCGYHFSTCGRRRVPKTNSPKTNCAPKKDEFPPKTNCKDEFPEDELRPEDEFPPEDEFRRRIPRRRIARPEDEFPPWRRTPKTNPPQTTCAPKTNSPRRRIPKTNSPKTNGAPKTNFPPEDELRRRITRRRIALKTNSHRRKRFKWTGWKRWNDGEEVMDGREELKRKARCI